MKPQVLQMVTSLNVFIWQIDMRSIVESWNKIQKQLKNIPLKDLSPKKIKTVASNFYLKSY